MAEEIDFEKILIIDGKVQADILVEHLKEHDIPACSQTEAPGARGNNAPPGEGIYVSRSDARAARKLLEDFFRAESSGEEDSVSEYQPSHRLRRRLFAAAALVILAAFFIYSIFGYVAQLL